MMNLIRRKRNYYQKSDKIMLIIKYLIIVFAIYFIFRFCYNYFKYGHSHKKNPLNEQSYQVKEITIPDKCPHCKNPNISKMKICEWCGGNVI